MTAAHEWEPIETAPKDGAWLLVFGFIWAGEIGGIVKNDVGEISIARWSDGKSDYGNDWWDDAGGGPYAAWCKPTHWMPLPTSPLSPSRSAGAL